MITTRDNIIVCEGMAITGGRITWDGDRITITGCVFAAHPWAP